jgi:hypothetical protein
MSGYLSDFYDEVGLQRAPRCRVPQAKRFGNVGPIPSGAADPDLLADAERLWRPLGDSGSDPLPIETGTFRPNKNKALAPRVAEEEAAIFIEELAPEL